MRGLSTRMGILILSVFLLMPAAVIAQTTATNPPISQPLVREGDLAVDLAGALKLGTAMAETEAESALSAVGIVPRNGWIADYPVTPDIVGEIQASISDAADSGKIPVGKDAALAAFLDIINGYNMSVSAAEGQEPGETSGDNYPEPAVMNNYYDTEGPPVVTYYAPPPDYAYLYTWVPYPFWWWDFWFPGFFVLVDFDRHEHGHGHHGHRDHGRDGGHFSNHFRDPATGRMSRIDPTNRAQGGTFAEAGAGRAAAPSVRRGAQAILNRTAPSRQFRGYGVSRPSPGIRSSAFDRFGTSRFERAASDRGFKGRSGAGQIRGGGAVRGGGFGGPRGGGARTGGPVGGGVRGGGRGGFHGGGRSR